MKIFDDNFFFIVIIKFTSNSVFIERFFQFKEKALNQKALKINLKNLFLNRGKN